MKSKLYLKILGLLIIVGGVSAYYYWPQISWLFEIPEPIQEKEWEVREMVYQEKPKDGEVQILPTADPKWNLYRNFKYGFQIQYPADWKYIKIFKNNVNSDIDVGFGDTQNDSDVIFFLYPDKSLGYILEQWKLKEKESINQELNINGKQITKMVYRNPYLDHDSYIYFFQSGTNTYGLSSDGSSSVSWYIDRMIKTLEAF